MAELIGPVPFNRLHLPLHHLWVNRLQGLAFRELLGTNQWPPSRPSVAWLRSSLIVLERVAVQATLANVLPALAGDHPGLRIGHPGWDNAASATSPGSVNAQDTQIRCIAAATFFKCLNWLVEFLI